MDSHVRDCLVSGYEDLMDGLELPDPDDRHVVAAAIRTRAAVILTYNLDNFPHDYLAKYGLEAQHPDEFIAHLIDLNPAAVYGAAKKQRAALKRPPMSVDEFLDCLAKQQPPKTVGHLRVFHELI